ncbi:MAG: NfeD family protein [Microvirga sp.]|nr:NfeD family protein [Beijerinckiaceae bacterium]HZY23205.1 NfeD family protein [Beijerinckiaceae bacterium]
MVAAFFSSLGPWSWIVLGLALMGLELLAPGVFLLWLGLAAVATGVLDWAFDLSWQAAAICFAILSVASVLLGRMVTRHPEEEDAGPSALNRRGHALVGRVFTLETPIVEGSGRIRVDDSSWRVTGPSAPAGAQVRVVRADGATLVVEQA